MHKKHSMLMVSITMAEILMILMKIKSLKTFTKREAISLMTMVEIPKGLILKIGVTMLTEVVVAPPTEMTLMQAVKEKLAKLQTISKIESRVMRMKMMATIAKMALKVDSLEGNTISVMRID